MYAFLWIGGVASYAFLGGPPEGVEWTAPVYLASAGALILAFTKAKDWVWLGVGAAIGFASELLGVAFGIPYSDYEYTNVLGVKVLGVPLVLATAWLVLLVYVQHWMVRLHPPKIVRPLLGAAWMTAIDLVIDPLAAGPLGYWRWEADGVYFGVPWWNFLGWFLTSLAIFAVMPRSFKPHVVPRVIGSSVILFFGITAFALGYYVPCAIAAVLIGIDVFSCRAFDGLKKPDPDRQVFPVQ
jgi:putative membrane protein